MIFLLRSNIHRREQDSPIPFARFIESDRAEGAIDRFIDDLDELGYCHRSLIQIHEASQQDLESTEVLEASWEGPHKFP